MTGIIPLDPKNKEHLNAAARLHAALLPDSPIPRLGNFFMKKFYYNKLVGGGLIHCELYRRDEDYVALSAYTEYPYTFMAIGKKRYLFHLISVLAVSLLSAPARIRIVWDVLRQGALRDRLRDDGISGEYLSLAVAPESAGFRDPVTGLRISNLMFERVIDHFKGKHFKEILLMIKKTNKKSQLFYHTYNAAPKEGRFVPEDCYLKAVPIP